MADSGHGCWGCELVGKIPQDDDVHAGVGIDLYGINLTTGGFNTTDNITFGPSQAFGACIDAFESIHPSQICLPTLLYSESLML